VAPPRIGGKGADQHGIDESELADGLRDLLHLPVAECPNVGGAIDSLVRALRSANQLPNWKEWERTSLEAPAYARRYGSPTILVDGRDIAGVEPGRETSCCRFVHHADLR